MTKRVQRPYKKTGRPPKNPPANASIRIAALAAAGHRVVGMARHFGTTPDTLYRWIEEDPALQDALAQGREVERMELDSLLKKAARKGNIVAAMFLLKARHGYREGDQSVNVNNVKIDFTLPGALKPEQFAALEHDAGVPEGKL